MQYRYHTNDTGGKLWQHLFPRFILIAATPVATLPPSLNIAVSNLPPVTMAPCQWDRDTVSLRRGWFMLTHNWTVLYTVQIPTLILPYAASSADTHPDNDNLVTLL